LFTAQLLLNVAVDPSDKQDHVDLVRLQRELETLKVKSGKRSRGLWVHARSWECSVGRCWAELLNSTLRADEMTAFLYFTNTPCDFVEKKREGSVLTLRGRKVSEVKTGSI
jgi:hypothetical protein